MDIACLIPQFWSIVPENQVQSQRKTAMASTGFGVNWNRYWNSPLGMDKVMLGSSPELE